MNSKHAPAGVWLGEDCDCPHVRHLWLLDVLADMRRYARDAALVEFEQSLGRVSEGLIEEIRQRVQPGPGGIAK
ncbi:MAG: hypothetical protein LJE68_14980 [Rhodobacter sp.]|nr:hypothetical protein [Rhodobacter sp.]